MNHHNTMKLRAQLRLTGTCVATLLAIGSLWAACASTSTAADNVMHLPEVKAFYADTSHCMYMADYPADVPESVTARYAKASEAAVSAMRQAQPALTQSQALLQLREGCSSVLQASAKRSGS